MQPVVHRVVELATGLNYRDAQGQWQLTREQFELTPRGAIARFGPHQVIIAPSLNTPGAVDLLTPDAQRLRLHLIGLSYFDSESGESVLLDEVADSQAELLPPNQILFRRPFTEIDATVRYTYTKAGLAQDVVLHERLPAPEAFGLSNEHTWLEVLSELTEESPLPQVERRVLRAEADPVQRQRMAAPDLTDDTLDFGTMRMAPGRAFHLPEAEPRDVAVGKRFEVIDGRRILFESVRWTEVRTSLERLPQRQAALGPAASRRPTGPRELPRRLVAQATSPASDIRLAMVPPAPGFVLDYDLTGSQSNFVFASGVTYYVSGTVNLTLTTVFQDAIVKFAAGARLYIFGAIQCQTGPFQPAIFTSRDDDTVGEIIPGSTGTPSASGYADPALSLYGSGSAAFLQHVRFAHAKRAMTITGVPSGQKHEIRHAQLVQCLSGFQLSNTEVALRNVLMHEVLTNFSGLYGIARLEHVTIHNAAWLNFNGACSTLTLTNCIVAGVTNALGTYTGQNNHVATTEDGLFVAVGAGANYLPWDSALHEAGTLAIHAGLLTELQQRTVDAPTDLAYEITADTTLVPQVTADSGNPDLGFHYPRVDYAISSLRIAGATLTLTNGVTVAVFGNTGVLLDGGGRLVSEGTPRNLNRFVRYPAVQEQPINWGDAFPGGVTLLNPYTTGAPAEIRCRFTEFYLMDGGNHVYSDAVDWRLQNLTLQDCRLVGGVMSVTGAAGSTASLLNTEFQRMSLDLFGSWELMARHNLFREGALSLWRESGTWLFHDNLFDRSLLTDAVGWTSPSAHSNNAYVGMGSSRLEGGGSSDKILGSLAWDPGTLGTNYLAAGSPLIDQGSRTAGAAGMAAFTTSTNATSLDTGQVDIGPHYVALTEEGQPLDTDGDGLPDYVEDADGSGTVNGTETAWDLWDTDYDGRSDGQEWGEGTDPLDPAGVMPVRLGWWRFDTEDWDGEQGQVPKETPVGVTRSAGWSGTVLYIPDAEVANLRYRTEEANHTQNINCRQGTIRFWFRPDWTSGSEQGPGTTARLIEVGDSQSSSSWWALSLNATGDQISFAAHGSNQATITYLTAPVSFVSGSWYQIVLTYGPSDSQLYVNGTAVGSAGLGVTQWPDAITRAAHGFSIGSDRLGNERVGGQIDELETFNYRWSSGNIVAHYETMLAPPETWVEFSERRTKLSSVDLFITKGITARMAVLVGSEDFASALWQPFATNSIVPLGIEDGEYEIWVGFKGYSDESAESWSGYWVTLDTVAPTVTIVSPEPSATLTVPMVQVEGWANEELSEVTLDVVPPGAEVVSYKAMILRSERNEESGEIDHCWFQGFDIDLLPGVNAVTLRAVDVAGNLQTMNWEWTVNPLLDTNAPTITVTWPADGAHVVGETTTVRGVLDDPTETIQAQVTAGTQTAEVQGIVERNGQFWVDDLPLFEGDNAIALTATDFAGHTTVVNLTVTRSPLDLTMNPVTLPDDGVSPITVSGHVTPGRLVSINGVAATVDSQGAWTADAVPVGTSGVAEFHVEATSTAIPPTPPVGTYFWQSKLPRLRFVHYENYANKTYTLEDASNKPPRTKPQHLIHMLDWRSDAPSNQIDSDDFSTCRLPQPGDPDQNDFMARLLATTWPVVGSGVTGEWRDGVLFQTGPSSKDKLTTSEFAPEQGGGLFKTAIHPQWPTKWGRKAYSEYEVIAGGRHVPKKDTFVLLNVEAWRQTTKSPAGLGSDGLDEPIHRSHFDCRPEVQLRWNQLSVMGKIPNPSDNCVFVRMPMGTTRRFFPTTKKNIPWYVADVALLIHKIQPMTWAKHPLMTGQPDYQAYIQSLFDQASENILAVDEDGEDGEDCPAYVEFDLVPAPSGWSGDFNDPKYNVFLQAEPDLKNLTEASFSEVKLVTSLPRKAEDKGNGTVVVTEILGSAMEPSSPPRIVLGASASARTAAHEYGHTRNLQHEPNAINLMYYKQSKGTSKTDLFQAAAFESQ